MNFYDEQDTPDMVDPSGYLGLFYRDPKPLQPISEQDLMTLFSQHTAKVAHIVRLIKEIDQDNNGYVTNQELEDIVKVVFKEVEGREIKGWFRKFASL